VRLSLHRLRPLSHTRRLGPLGPLRLLVWLAHRAPLRPLVRLARRAPLRLLVWLARRAPLRPWVWLAHQARLRLSVRLACGAQARPPWQARLWGRLVTSVRLRLRGCPVVPLWRLRSI
jgi:hypothetical protein